MSHPAPFGSPIRPTRRMDTGMVLSVAQIAARTGTSPSGIYQRIKKGQTGAELLRGPRTKLYEVGKERLTLAQLCERTGLKAGAMYSRIVRGVTGKDLLIKRGDRKRRGMARSPTQYIAFKLAYAFGEHVPTTKEIRAAHPMSDTSAMRWRNAMQQALKSMGKGA